MTVTRRYETLEHDIIVIGAGARGRTFGTVNVVVRRSHGAIMTALEPIPTMPGELKRLFADPT